MLETRSAQVEVVLEGDERGRTVCVEGEPNAEVGVELDLEEFFRFLVHSVKRCSKLG
jgi:inosine-uridine nucleoside N-ribohydrolase